MADPKSGPGRVLIAVYAIFALAATPRSGVQLATKFGDAPLAYLLSAVAAVIYIVATVGLARGATTIVAISCTVELIGVLTIGTWSLLDPAAFPDATVWSVYGRGYGFVPVVLPILGLWWVRRTGWRR